MWIVQRVEVCEPGTLMQASYNVTAKRALNAMHNEQYADTTISLRRSQSCEL
jgi:hypothetical protein